MRLRGARAPKFGFWSEGRGGVPIYKLVIALMEDTLKPTLADRMTIPGVKIGR